MKAYRWLSVSSALVIAGIAVLPTSASANEYLIDDNTPRTQTDLPASPFDGFMPIRLRHTPTRYGMMGPLA